MNFDQLVFSKKILSQRINNSSLASGKGSSRTGSFRLFSNDQLATLPVPEKLWFQWTDSKIRFPPETSIFSPSIIPYSRNPIPVPEVDKLGTEFIKEELPIQYTIWNIYFLSGRTGFVSSQSETSTFSFSYALDVLEGLKKLSAGEVTGQYSKQFQNTISFYLENSKALWDLEAKSTRNNEKYRQMISGVLYDPNDPGEPEGNDFVTELRRANPLRKDNSVLPTFTRIGDKIAGDFMNWINNRFVEKGDDRNGMTPRLREHFENLKQQMPKRGNI